MSDIVRYIPGVIVELLLFFIFLFHQEKKYGARVDIASKRKFFGSLIVFLISIPAVGFVLAFWSTPFFVFYDVAWVFFSGTLFVALILTPILSIFHIIYSYKDSSLTTGRKITQRFLEPLGVIIAVLLFVGIMYFGKYYGLK